MLPCHVLWCASLNEHRRLPLLVGAGVAVMFVIFAAAGTLHSRSADADDRGQRATIARLPPPDTTVNVLGTASGRPIASGFVGVSFEFPALTAYTGFNPHAVNPVLEQFLRNLAPGGTPVIRIGGNSTDTTWWPTPGVARPAGISYTLTPRWLAVVKALARNVGGRVILGVNLEARRPALAAAEAAAFVKRLGRAVLALEPGNEPTRYRLFPWYRVGRHLVWARPASYGFGAFNHEFARAVALFPPGVMLAGPTFAGFSWLTALGRFLGSQPGVRLVTVHRYNLNRCWTAPGQPGYPTVPRLLSLYASRRDVVRFSRYVNMVHARGLRFRVDEMNSVACGGKFGVSTSFASALWAVDALFSLAQAGVDGVNLHTFPGAAYELFNFRRAAGRWVGTASPEYYGLLMFAQAAPVGSRLLPTRTAATRAPVARRRGRAGRLGGAAVRAWATRGPDGTLRIVLLNDDLHRTHVVRVLAPVAALSAVLERLSAPSAYAQSGVTLGGMSLSGSRTGRLGRAAVVRLLAATPGSFVVALPPASAGLLTVRP